MANDKKKKADKKGAKKAQTKSGGKTAAPKRAKSSKTASRLQTLVDNPMVTEVVAAALVATAAALKDSGKARQLAEQAGDQLEKLAAKNVDRGNALWQIALEVGKKALDQLTTDGGKSKKSK